MTSNLAGSPLSIRYPHSTRNAVTSTSTTPFAIASGSRPTHAAGIVHNASRSRIARRSTMSSRNSGALGLVASRVQACVGCCFDPVSTTLPQLKQELVRWNKERVRLKNATDDNHGMGSHDIHYNAGAKLGAVVRSYYRIFVSRQDVIQTRLVFHQIIQLRAYLPVPTPCVRRAA